MTLKQAYSYSVQFLGLNNVDEADFKALCLVCHLAGIKNSEYNFHTDDEIITSRLAKALWRLKEGEPLQYVLGVWDFYESEFCVGRGVLIPRPETEELVDMAVKHIEKIGNAVVYDLCSGSGCIGVSIAKKCKNTKVYCIEKSEEAFKYLKKNAQKLDNVVLINDDISNSFDLPKADVIISNPPYIKTDELNTLQSEVRFEPEMALDGGDDGLYFYRLINDKWSSYLKNDGKLFLEIGNEQGEALKNILTNFKNIEIHKDIYKNDRIVTACAID